MAFFYHVVGKELADRDFPRTVGHAFKLSEEDQIALSPSLIQEIRDLFPEFRFYCWGVPLGANPIFSRMKTGDWLLLIDTFSERGDTTYLCKITAILRDQNHELSNILWKDSGYPLIMFLDPLRVNFSWKNFVNLMDYGKNYRARGYLLNVAQERINFLGGEVTLISKILDGGLEEDEEYGEEYVELLENMLAPPTLCEDSGLIEVKRKKRSRAFSRKIMEIYNSTCAITGIRLVSPDGKNAEAEAAHIYPKSLNGADDVRNGICLSKIMHWAFDNGWISIDSLYRVIAKDLPEGPGYDFLKKFVGRKISVPANKAYLPNQLYLQAHRELQGF